MFCFSVIIVLLAVTADHCECVTPTLYANVEASRPCEVTNPQYWILINWYFERVKYVVVSSILDTNLTRSDTCTTFIRQFSTSVNFPILVFPTNLDFAETDISLTDSYSWSGKKFATRKGNAHIRPKRQIRKSFQRKDEPDTGMLVVVRSEYVLDKYLVGTARGPFRYPRRYYIIVLRRVSDGWKDRAATLLARLWEDYGIINVIIMAPCSDLGEEMIGSYEPFTLNANRSNDSVSYGDCCWTALEKLDYGDDIIRKLRTMNGFPMKISIFERFPTVLLEKDVPTFFLQSYFSKGMKLSSGFNGFDGLVLGNMAETLNFSVTPIRPTGSAYGYQADNGTFVGSLGDVLYHQAYASFNGRIVADYGTNDIEFMYPVFFDKFCIIAPKALRIPEWMAIFKCFNKTVWLLLVVTYVFCGYFWYMLKQWIESKTKRNMVKRRAFEKESKIYNKFTVTMIQMCIIMLSGSSRMPYRTIERLFIASCLLLNIIIAGTFQGSLFTSYSTKSYYPDIETLEQLDKSGLPIGTTSESLKSILGNGDTAILRSLLKKFSFFNDRNPIIDQTAQCRDICAIERKADINIIIAKNYELDDGTVQLHAIKECPRSAQLAYIVNKNSPFLPVFNSIIQRFNEGGLLLKWYQMVEFAIILNEKKKRRNYRNNHREFTLREVQTAFYILGIGLLGCLIVFVLELCLNHNTKFSTITFGFGSKPQHK